MDVAFRALMILIRCSRSQCTTNRTREARDFPIYIMTAAFFWLRPATPAAGYPGALEIGAMLAALRVYPRFWNMWIQTTFPSRLLLVEVINGTLGCLFVACFLQAVAV